MVILLAIGLYLYGMFVVSIWRKMFGEVNWIGVICIGWFVSPLVFICWLAMMALEAALDRFA